MQVISCMSREPGDKHKGTSNMPHTLPTRPWQYIASDLFEIDGKQYLLTVDRYTKYPLVDYKPNPVSSHAVTDKMKTNCAMYGRPDEIMTDGGPQYTGNNSNNSRRIGASVTQLAHLTTQGATHLSKDM